MPHRRACSASDLERLRGQLGATLHQPEASGCGHLAVVPVCVDRLLVVRLLEPYPDRAPVLEVGGRGQQDSAYSNTPAVVAGRVVVKAFDDARYLRGAVIGEVLELFGGAVEDHTGSRGRRFSATAARVDPDTRPPAPRYWLVHTFAHVLIREMAMSCGYGTSTLTLAKAIRHGPGNHSRARSTWTTWRCHWPPRSRPNVEAYGRSSGIARA